MLDIRADFAAFFEAVWNVTPFDWQVALAERVTTEGRWPDVIDLPTGAGKTSALDIAVYALARRPEVMPRRIAFVVDRRTIVDQTYQHAQLLADRLTAALAQGPDAVSGQVARALAALGGAGIPLDTGRLRGGTGTAAPPSEWLRWPDQPAVVISTVDQFGSRLLLRGYGVSPGMRPIHAGLTGVDTLLLLDEVHLSTALVDTLTAVQRLVAAMPVGRPLQVVQMSATPVGQPARPFPEDRAMIEGDPVLAPRVLARKNCRLVPRIGAPRQPCADAWAKAVPALLAQLGVADGVVGIVVNRVATAVAVHAALGQLGHESILVTGRMRSFERANADATAARWANPTRGHEPGVRVVVATQCIEVGADYSFDGLITEICPLASLKQRLGRLDRRGARAASGTPSVALIVATADQAVDDAVYGEALGATLSALVSRFGTSEFDGGPLSRDLAQLGVGLDVPPVRAGILMPSDMDDLADTESTRPLSGKVDALLHGFREPNADVSLVWRFDLPPDSVGADPVRVDTAQLILAALPAFPPEKLDVPIAAVRRWLSGRDPMQVADVDAPGEPADSGPLDRHAWRWDDGQVVRVGAKDIRPGDLLFVPANYGGLRDGAWDPTSGAPVQDVADESARAAGWVALRPRDDTAWRKPDTDEESDGTTRRSFLIEAAGLTSPEQVVGPRDIVYYGDRWAVIRPGARQLDGLDETNSHLGVPVSLGEHVLGVASTARAVAIRCGLSEELAADLALAGELHDLGKADDRFQLSLVGDEIALALQSEPLAKSGARRSHRRTGDPTTDYPLGTRHEFLSAILAESDPTILAPAHDRDLVLHLIVTHHGHGRPWPIVAPDPSPRIVRVVHRGRALSASSNLPDDFGAQVCERFQRLVNRYGHHGLAWLEAVFRLADHRRSESEAYDKEAEA